MGFFFELTETLNTLSTELNLAYAIVLKNHYAQSESNRLGLTLEEPTFEGKIVSSSSYRIIWSEHPLYGNLTITATMLGPITPLYN